MSYYAMLLVLTMKYVESNNSCASNSPTIKDSYNIKKVDYMQLAVMDYSGL